MKESLDMSEINDLDDTKHDRLRQFLMQRDRSLNLDFKNPRHNTTSFKRNEEIKRKYNL